MNTELATRPAGLFGTLDPMEVVARATEVATALGKVLEDQSLVSRISGRNYVRVEGWTLLASMVGASADVEWSRPLSDGWEARAVARTGDGRLLGSAEAQCTRQESTWRGRDDYAIRSMAQTRAVAKALRMGLGFIVQLAGYDATPAEEMPGDHGPTDEVDSIRQPPPRRPRARKPKAEPEPDAEPTLADLRARLGESARVRRIDADTLLGMAKEVGVTGDKATREQVEKVLAAVESLPIPENTPLAEVPDHEFPY